MSKVYKSIKQIDSAKLMEKRFNMNKCSFIFVDSKLFNNDTAYRFNN